MTQAYGIDATGILSGQHVPTHTTDPTGLRWLTGSMNTWRFTVESSGRRQLEDQRVPER